MYIGMLRERLAARKAQAAQPNVVVVGPGGGSQQPQPQLAAQAVQPAAAAAGGQPVGLTSLGSGVSIATSTPISLSNPIELDMPTYRKTSAGLLGGRRLRQQVVQLPAQDDSWCARQ
jgi:hypothetical protein